LRRISGAQGVLLGRLADAGLALRDEASLLALTEDVLKTREIEGDLLDAASVRSSKSTRADAARAMNGRPLRLRTNGERATSPGPPTITPATAIAAAST